MSTKYVLNKDEIDASYALASLVPNAEYTYNETKGFVSWDSVNDTRSITKPTQTQIDAEVIRLKEQWDKDKYERDRRTAYPSYADQFDLIYHSGIDAWKTKIKETKDKYPKP